MSSCLRKKEGLMSKELIEAIANMKEPEALKQARELMKNGANK